MAIAVCTASVATQACVSDSSEVCRRVVPCPGVPTGQGRVALERGRTRDMKRGWHEWGASSVCSAWRCLTRKAVGDARTMAHFRRDAIVA